MSKTEEYKELLIFKDTNKVLKLIEAFDVRDFADYIYDVKEIKSIALTLDWIEEVTGCRLPLIPLIELYQYFMSSWMDCNSCPFDFKYRKEFLDFIIRWINKKS